MTKLHNFGEYVETARLDAQRSRAEVAQHAGISPAYLRIIEKGENPKTERPSRPSAEVVASLATALDLDASDLLLRAGYENVGETVSTAIAQVGSRGSLRDSVGSINEITRNLRGRSDFFVSEIDARLRVFASDLNAWANGSLRCSAEEEPDLTKKAVTVCKSSLEAISYQDEEWWDSPDGDSYLKAHAQLCSENVAVTRVFIVEMEIARSRLQSTFQKHDSLGIDWYAVEPGHVPEAQWQDLVVYDNHLVRRGSATARNLDRKSAEFTDEPARVQQAIEDFNQVLGIAQRNAIDPSVLLPAVSGGTR